MLGSFLKIKDFWRVTAWNPLLMVSSKKNIKKKSLNLTFKCNNITLLVVPKEV